jgi:hypothetical protein
MMTSPDLPMTVADVLSKIAVHPCCVKGDSPRRGFCNVSGDIIFAGTDTVSAVRVALPMLDACVSLGYLTTNGSWSLFCLTQFVLRASGWRSTCVHAQSRSAMLVLATVVFAAAVFVCGGATVLVVLLMLEVCIISSTKFRKTLFSLHDEHEKQRGGGLLSVDTRG